MGSYYIDYKRLDKRVLEECLRLNLTQAQLTDDIDKSDTQWATGNYILRTLFSYFEKIRINSEIPVQIWHED